MKISDIKPNPNNPRVIKDDAFEKLCNSINEFPKMMALRPMVVDQDNVVLGGNMRLKALQHLGFKEIPDTWVRKASELTEEEKRRFIIADNVSGGDWDWGVLQADWDLGELEDWGLEIPDYEVKQPEAVEDDYQIPDETETDIVLGDLFEMGEHRLLCGDSTDSDTVAKLMNGEKADMVFTDPPYALFGNSTGVANVVDDNMVRPFFKNIMKMCQNNTKLFGHIYMCCDWHSAFSIQSCAREVDLKAKNMCIWDKGDGGVGAMYQQCYEIVWFFDNSPTSKQTMGKTKAGVITVNGVPNIWRVSRVTSDREHNAQKPIEMISVPISNGTKEDELVLDLFLGSGSTMVAAHQLNRKCYGMELDPKYCQVIIDRMIKLDPDLKITRNGQPYENTEIKQKHYAV
jgi:DNA modification methylase